ncbi:MAG: DMT family transporter [Patescibacteria group bacterium]
MNRYNFGFVFTEVTMLIVGKYLLNLGFHPYFYGVITGVCASLIMLKAFKLHPTKATFIVTLPTIVFFTIANSLGFMALKYSQLTSYNFLIQSSLLTVPLLAHWFLKEKIHWLIFPLSLINLIGIALLVSLNQAGFQFGNVLTLLAAIFVGLDFVWQKRAALKINQNIVAFWRRLISSLFLGIFWLMTPSLGTATFSNALILIPISLLYVVFSLLMVRALTVQPVADFNLFITISPVLTAIAAFWLLGETMTLKQIIGASLIVISIIVYNWYRKTKT